jgi:hypothetical protein
MPEVRSHATWRSNLLLPFAPVRMPQHGDIFLIQKNF